LGNSHNVAENWNMAAKHSLFRGDLYLLALSQYSIVASDESEKHGEADQTDLVYEDVDVVNDTDERFVNYRASVSGYYGSDMSLWSWTWHRLRQRLKEYFEKELLHTIQIREGIREREREMEILVQLEMAESVRSYDL
jgi:hypothetical protein